MRWFVFNFLILTLSLSSLAQTGRDVQLRPIGPSGDRSTIEFRGVSPGGFDLKMWQAGNLHLVPDARSPMLEPLPGKFRNIYAPSAVQTPDGWRLFYGAWDGLETGNDHLYSLQTRDFLEFTNRQMLIQPGSFQHICNVSAVATSVEAYAMFGTLYPDENGLNKPAVFMSRDGKSWNDQPAPYTVQRSDIISIAGYDKYRDADINGMNVMLLDGNKFHIYFANFKDFGHIYRATSSDGHNYVLDGNVLNEHLAPNDVKKFQMDKAPASSWYLMGLHMNTQQLWYSLSNDPMKFPPARKLFDHLDDSDRYIVSVGFVVQGSQDRLGRILLGVLYGAGAKPSLDANRIFARWLQKRLVIVSDEKALEVTQSLGPYRQVLKVEPGKKLTGRIDVYAEDGRTLIGSTETVNIQAGRAYAIAIQ